MNYYVISPNVFNDGNDYSTKMFEKNIAAVGWNVEDAKGQQFINIQKGDCIIVAQRKNWKWKYHYLGIVEGDELQPSFGTISKQLSNMVDLRNGNLGFDNWTANGSNQIPSPQRIKVEDNQEIIKNINRYIYMERYNQLLESNYNLILTGAPGTGKTFLAKEIAESFGAKDERYGFVQFHPSFDYTDFIEGLRPIKAANSSEIGFERKDGIFMAFCRKALKAYQNSENKAEAPKYVFVIDEINRGEMSKIFGELFFSVDPGYRGVEGRISTQYSNLWTEKDVYDETLKEDDKYKFYIPKNVYIIGTMNDIDRSVESMDFAMRRRFAFKEVKADSRVEMINESNALKSYFEDICTRMHNLNLCILTIQGLSSAYQIGASYYLKLKNYLEDDKLTDSSWENLWENHIYGLLFEYLRGMPDIDKQLLTLQKAYNMDEKYEEKDGVVKKVITEANE